jgi:hypothetical protein
LIDPTQLASIAEKLAYWRYSRSSRPTQEGKAAPRSEVRQRIEAAAWAAFFIWIGSAILANVGWGWFLAGLGAIVLAAQAALQVVGEKVEAAWLSWELLSLKWPLAPLLMILLGIGILWQAFFARPGPRP